MRWVTTGATWDFIYDNTTNGRCEGVSRGMEVMNWSAELLICLVGVFRAAT